MSTRSSFPSAMMAALLVCIFLAAACASPPQPGAASDAPQVVPPPTQALMSIVELTPTAPSLPDPTPDVVRVANADVEFVHAVHSDADMWTFHVTVHHPDTGWEDYADGWDVVLPDGTVVKPDADSPFTRLLLHPHETEQPFTRSQSGIVILPDVTQVTVRAHDLVDGWGGREVVVDLSTASGPGFDVQR